MSLPPRWIRRLTVAPAVVAAAVLLVWTMPLLLLLVLLTSRFARIGRLPRALWMVVVILVWEATALVVLFGTWIASGFGLATHTGVFRNIHYRLIGRFLEVLFRQIRWALRLKSRSSTRTRWGRLGMPRSSWPPDMPDPVTPSSWSTCCSIGCAATRASS